MAQHAFSPIFLLVFCGIGSQNVTFLEIMVQNLYFIYAQIPPPNPDRYSIIVIVQCFLFSHESTFFMPDVLACVVFCSTR